MQQMQGRLSQHEQASAAQDQQIAAVEDWHSTERMRASDPDLFDKDTGRFKPEIGQGVMSYVGSLGIDRDTFKSLLQSNAQIPMRDHRFQQLVIDASRFRAAKAKAAEAKKAPLPEVQRPGLSNPGRRDVDAEFSRLDSKRSLTLREASKLNKLRRQRDA
jgi:hypothetical protein